MSWWQVTDGWRIFGGTTTALSGREHRMASSFLSRENTIAPPGYNRFLVPPAALAVHLSIGQVYAFSTFNLPLTKILGVTHSVPADWNLKEIGWIFSIAIAILGVSAAVFGRWVERVGPRKSMFVAALCFGGGFIVSAAADSESPTSLRSPR
jgi:MFS family permease